jgi:RNA-directed DNA polymerase
MECCAVRVPSPPIAVPVSLAACHAAWRRARRGKRPSSNQLAFEARWLDRLLDLKTALRAGVWQPRRTVSFIVSHPKTREIHAPDFADRVVHHLLVQQLEKIYEPVFIHDSYANRTGKGSHAAVDRLEHFVRQHNGTGWYLQLDIHNFFNTIHRPTLYAMLCKRLAQTTNAPLAQRMADGHALALRSLCHKLLVNKATEQVRDADAAARLPAHKRLANAQPGCGLPVGNLTSQFFANVYLNALDQFVKHTLKCKHYVRYVDDFVLIAKTPEQLRDWQDQIEHFLAQTLRLTLKDAVLMQPLCQGIDFLGYRGFVGHRRVRPRVVQHCKAKLAAWAAQHVKQSESGTTIHANSTTLAHLQSMLGSYWGHFAHANSVRLRRALFARFAWLNALFTLSPAGELHARWVLQGETFATQAAALQAQWPAALCQIQKGYLLLELPQQQPTTPASAAQPARVRAVQTGWLRHGTRRREITHWFIPHAAPDSTASII